MKSRSPAQREFDRLPLVTAPIRARSTLPAKVAASVAIAIVALLIFALLAGWLG